MTSILARKRELAKQRTVSLFVDQEEKFNKLCEEYKINLSYGELTRVGVDLALEQLEAELKKTKKK
jgi:hypothetical protein